MECHRHSSSRNPPPFRWIPLLIHHGHWLLVVVGGSRFMYHLVHESLIDGHGRLSSPSSEPTGSDILTVPSKYVKLGAFFSKLTLNLGLFFRVPVPCSRYCFFSQD